MYPLNLHLSQPLSIFSLSYLSLLFYRETQTPKGQHQQRTVRLLFPLFTHGTAWDAIERAAPLEKEPTGPWPFYEERAMSICRDVARALSFMHSKGFAHR